MTRLLTCGYETSDVDEAGTSTIGANASLTTVSSVPTPRAGSYCLKAGHTGTTFSATYKTFNLPAARTDIWIRFAYFANIASTETAIARLFDSLGATQNNLAYNPADGLLRLYRGITGTNLIGTASGGFAQNTWHVIEWHTQILTATTGTSEVWLDGTRVINFSGDNSNTTTLNVSSVHLGLIGSLTDTGGYVAVDDIAINDVAGTSNSGRPGDGRVVLLKPTGAGSSTVLARGGTDTGANWSQTSELPPSMSQYVTSATAADRDLYSMANLGVAVNSINVVEEIVFAQNSDAGAGSIGLTIKSGSTTNEATAQALGTSAAYKTARWETDPDTSAAWTSGAVDALEVGVTVR